MNPIVSLLTSLTMGVEQAYHKELKRCKELILSFFPFIVLLTILCWVIKNTFTTSLQNMPRNNIQTWATLFKWHTDTVTHDQKNNQNGQHTQNYINRRKS